MGKTHPSITEKHAEFMKKMPVFFVATASTSQSVNVSPRSPGTSCVVTSPKSVAIADLSGSGCETAAHVLENGRMTLLFVNILDGPPMMIRLHGTATIQLAKEVDPELLGKFPEDLTKSKGFRCVYFLDVQRISTSCGYSMPVMTLQSYRTILEEHNNKTDMDAYRTLKNCFSIDGLPSYMLLDDKVATSVGPKPDAGYIHSKTLHPLDVVGAARARRRAAELRASAARGGPGTPHHGDSKSSTSWLAAVSYVVIGVALTLAVQGAQAVLQDAAVDGA